jgi:hypothetical protein
MFGAHHALRLADCTVMPMSEGEAFFDTHVALCTAATVVEASHQISTFVED